MPSVNLPIPERQRNDKETLSHLLDTMVRYKKELEYLLRHLDEANVIKAQSVESTWVYGGPVTEGQVSIGPDTTFAEGYDPSLIEVIDTFLGLTDTPTDYIGQAGKFPKVNIEETALEFGEVVLPDMEFTNLTDAPSSFVGAAGQVAAVNDSETALIFSAVSDLDFILDGGSAFDSGELGFALDGGGA